MENIKIKIKIKIITSYKLADAYICSILEQKFSALEVIRYRIPAAAQRKWYVKKLQKEGFLKSAGIKLMGVYLGIGNVINSMKNTTVWQSAGIQVPQWNNIRSIIHDCCSEEELFTLLQDAQLVIALDTLRLPQKFFLQLKAPFLQAVYGFAPKYTGHTGIFWAYAKKDISSTGVSVVLRSKYFNKANVLGTASVFHKLQRNTPQPAHKRRHATCKTVAPGNYKFCAKQCFFAACNATGSTKILQHTNHFLLS